LALQGRPENGVFLIATKLLGVGVFMFGAQGIGVKPKEKSLK
jgi:hypothetical protein